MSSDDFTQPQQELPTPPGAHAPVPFPPTYPGRATLSESLGENESMQELQAQDEIDQLSYSLATKIKLYQKRFPTFYHNGSIGGHHMTPALAELITCLRADEPAARVAGSAVEIKKNTFARIESFLRKHSLTALTFDQTLNLLIDQYDLISVQVLELDVRNGRIEHLTEHNAELDNSLRVLLHRLHVEQQEHAAALTKAQRKNAVTSIFTTVVATAIDSAVPAVLPVIMPVVLRGIQNLAATFSPQPQPQDSQVPVSTPSDSPSPEPL